VNLVDLPDTPSFLIPVVGASGSLGGDFMLGSVQHAGDGFVTMSFDLKRTSNSIALAGEVTGLNGAGSVAAAFAPGVQSLVNAQIGSWRQRTNALANTDGGVTPWLRVFTESGGVDASHNANFGSGGSFGFHQSNQGLELGLAYRPSEHIAFGALLADTRGSQTVAGAGHDRFDGQSTGLFATWLGSNGFYLDLSHRWIDVDAHLSAAEGAYTTSASAQATNVEAGFTAWTTAGGLHVVPQLQYTRTLVHDIHSLQSSLADFTSDGGVSSRGRLGVALDKSFEGKHFVWSTYGALSAVREFDGQYEHAINGGLQGSTGTDGTSAMLELGLGARRGNFSVSGGLNWTDGGAVDSSTGGQLVLRYTW
jgi:outer membrane autotransporter protein